MNIDNIRNKIYQIMEDRICYSKEEIKNGMSLKNDLKLDSLDIMDFSFFFEKEFNINYDVICGALEENNVQTVDDLVQQVHNLVQKKSC